MSFRDEHAARPLRYRRIGETMMKLAIPIWNERVSPVFDTAARLLVVDLDDGGERARDEIALTAEFPPHRVRRLVELGVDTLICGAVSNPLGTLVVSAGITLIPFVSGQVDEVLGAFMAGRLDDTGYLMPGCGGGRRRWAGRCGRGAGGGMGRGANTGGDIMARGRGQGQGGGQGKGRGGGMGRGQGQGRGGGMGGGMGQGQGRSGGMGRGMGQGQGRGLNQGSGQAPGQGRGMNQGGGPAPGQGRGRRRVTTAALSGTPVAATPEQPRED